MAARPCTPEELCAALAAAPHPLTAREAERLLAYADDLVAHGRAPNLTALDSVARVVEVLVRPSLLVAHAMERAPTRIADVGSGNGFPGCAAAALWPDAQVLLVERRARKAQAVAALTARHFPDVDVAACDVREVPREAPAWIGTCDLVMLRAVGPLGETTKIAAPLLSVGGRLVHWKVASLPRSEREDGQRAARAAGLRVLPDVSDPTLGTARLVVYEKGRA